ncbi:MAG: prolipoprotein diacylglyceryl transferase [Streptosporangiaceae bacterium]
MASLHLRPPLGFIPSPPASGFHLGPLDVHFYGLMYVVGITLAIIITRRRWRAVGGDPALVGDVATWAVPAGIIGGRLYFDITTPAQITPHAWWGVFAVWNGGLGIWGGVLGGALAGIWRVRRAGAATGAFANAVAPALLVAQAIGRIGNYFNQELYGKPSRLPWAVEISPAHRAGLSPALAAHSTFQPSFLYELIFDLAFAAVLVWLGHHRRIRPWGLFALYVAGYSAYRIFEETIRIDYSVHILGLRLNFYIAIIGTLAGLAWFAAVQRKPMPEAAAGRGAAAADAAAADAVTGDGPAAEGEAADSAAGTSAAGTSAAAGSGRAEGEGEVAGTADAGASIRTGPAEG